LVASSVAFWIFLPICHQRATSRPWMSPVNFADDWVVGQFEI
jgi:hypothetical protein